MSAGDWGDEGRDEGRGAGDIERRGLLMTGLITGLTLATTRVEAQVIRTSATGLDAGEVAIPVEGGAIPAYRAKPIGPGPFPIVLVIEEIFGVHDYIKDVCRRLAKLGYLAVAPELYARLADLSKMSDVQQILHDVIGRAPDTTMLTDLDAAAAWAAAHGGDPSRMGVTGFCRGGRNTWLYAAHNQWLEAAVAWYGPVLGTTTPLQPHTPTELAAQLQAPLLGLYGGNDDSIRPTDVQAAAERAHAAGKTVEIVVFPDAQHGFHADYRPSYNAAAAAAGWDQMLAWFRRYGVA